MNMHTQIMRQLMHNKKYDAIAEFARINSPNKPYNLIVCEYMGDAPRLMKRNDDIYVLCPNDMSIVQENGIADSIATGTIFDDAENADNTADYMQKTILPINAVINKHGMEPKKLRIIISGVIGRINDDGRVEITINDAKNGENFIHDLTSGTGNEHVNRTCDHYLGITNDENFTGHQSLPMDVRRDIHGLIDEIDSITDVGPDDEVTDDDFIPFNSSYENEDNETFEKEEPDTDDNESGPIEPEEVSSDNDDDGPIEPEEVSSEDEDEEDAEFEDDNSDEDEDDDDTALDNESEEEDEYDSEPVEESYIAEGLFGTKQPKKLKPIPRSIISYITVEINAIKDTNDQAMLAGYTSAKLELVDFYLNCIDTQDPRYIVPHNKQYLVQMQTELNDLLKRILQIRPYNKFDRVWSAIT